MDSNPSQKAIGESEAQLSISPEEGLRLIRAFLRIADEQARLDVIQFAEKQAGILASQ